MAHLLRFQRNVSSLRGLLKATPQNIRAISTTPKKQETIAADTAPKTAEDFRNVAKQKNWVSWGFDRKDREYDNNVLHATAFWSISVCMVVVGFIWGYAPDPLLRDWAQREAFLVLRRREAAGEEPISRDYVEASLVQLPSDEELGNTEIII